MTALTINQRLGTARGAITSLNTMLTEIADDLEEALDMEDEDSEEKVESVRGLAEEVDGLETECLVDVAEEFNV